MSFKNSIAQKGNRASTLGNGGKGEDNRYQGAYTGKGTLLEAGAPLSFLARDSDWDGLPLGGLGGEAPLPSLVGQGITQQRDEVCQEVGWLRGECEHGTIRWIKLSCKKRTCPVCGKRRKHLIAWRIALGIEILGGDDGGAWFVGTFDKDICKGDAVKVQNKFLRWLRKESGYKVEYASVWEAHKSGRLHLNLVLAPWRYVGQKVLSRAWQRYGGGKVVWIQRVGFGIGKEVAKARDRERIGAYVAKFDQMVLSGRGVNYSKGFPKLPPMRLNERKGKVTWRWVGHLEAEADIFESELEKGYWVEVAPNEYAFRYGEDCDCFEYKDSS